MPCYAVPKVNSLDLSSLRPVQHDPTATPADLINIVTHHD